MNDFLEEGICGGEWENIPHDQMQTVRQRVCRNDGAES
jgi:hypothetical protein